MNIDLNFKYEKLLDSLRNEFDTDFDIALILGSGLGDFTDSVNTVKTIETSSLPGYPISTVEGHKGFIHQAEYMGKKLLLFQGRIHFYEGYHISEVVLPVFIADKLGAKKILLTNAAGGINPNFSPGDLMVINDFISFDVKKYLSTFLGLPSLGIKNKFIDFPDRKIIDKIFEAAAIERVRLREGIYYLTKGPSYETPSEIRMMSKLGADAVGMSTAHEALFAKYLGMEVGAVSLITNYASGISPVKLSHSEVMETAEKAKTYFEKLVKRFIEIL